MEFFTSFLSETGYRIELLFAVLRRPRSVFTRARWIVDQLYRAGVQVVHVVLLVGLFIGMIVAYQTGIELANFGQQDRIGPIVAVSMAREMGPFITATILAAAYGSSIAAELGTMAVSDELAALEVLSVDAISLLVVPRVTALVVMCPLLTVVCDTVGILGGAVVAPAQLGVERTLYFDSAVEALRGSVTFFSLPKDVYAGLLKSAAFGLVIGVISCASGLRARGGALGVGSATTRAVRDSIIATIITNFLLTAAMY